MGTGNGGGMEGSAGLRVCGHDQDDPRDLYASSMDIVIYIWERAVLCPFVSVACPMYSMVLYVYLL